jgi:hypothetical protein
LKQLLQWQEAASSLGKPASYVERIREVTASYQRGLPLSEKTIAARQQDARCLSATAAETRTKSGLGNEPIGLRALALLTGATTTPPDPPSFWLTHLRPENPCQGNRSLDSLIRRCG